MRALALLSKKIFIVGTSPIVCDVGSSVSAFPAASWINRDTEARATIPRLDSVTYFRPRSCGGKISFKFSGKNSIVPT